MIIGELGIRGGMMRPRAIRHNPATIVAWLDFQPVGWLTVAWLRGRKQPPHMQIFVRPDLRRQGIGRKLYHRMLSRFDLLDGAIYCYHDNDKRSEKFFNAIGVT